MIAEVINDSETKNTSIFSLSENIIIFFALMCFSISLFLPVFFTSGQDIYGFWVLATGWIALVFLQLAWYANPLNLLALLLAQRHPKIAFLMSCIALLAATSSFVFYEIPIGTNYEKVFIKEYGLGLYFWYLSHCLILFALFIRFFASLKNKNQSI